MIYEGCLDGVDEVYGFHQWPTDEMGQVWVKPGPMMYNYKFYVRS